MLMLTNISFIIGRLVLNNQNASKQFFMEFCFKGYCPRLQDRWTHQGEINTGELCGICCIV